VAARVRAVLDEVFTDFRLGRFLIAKQARKLHTHAPETARPGLRKMPAARLRPTTMKTETTQPRRRILLAYSGGLDTSFCIAHYTRRENAEVIAAIVDTGGIDANKRAELEKRALAIGASEFRCIDGKQALARDVLRYLIAGNVRRGGAYPLCVAAERAVQARLIVEYAREKGATAIAHGSTGAGNDQVRFEVAIRALAPGIEPLAPVRDMGLTRAAELAALKDWGLDHLLPTGTNAAYSINRGLWGVTIGGRETTGSELPLPESAYVITTSPAKAPDQPQKLTISFGQGIPVAVDGQPMGLVALIEHVEAIAAKHGVGRGMHLGDTIIGIKGRVAYEAPAAEVLLLAHRELEKLTLTHRQQRVKDAVAQSYGDFVHEAQFFEPAARDIEALFESSQRTVSGDVDVELWRGTVRVLGCRSPFSMMAASGARYGEETSGYTGADAAGFSKMLGMAARIAGVARGSLDAPEGGGL
jgi:argininosuccinate synthase